jgi:hypothetical protein
MVMSPNFFKKLFGKREEDSSGLLWIYSQCDECGERFKTLIRKYNDLSPTYKEEGPAFIFKKELIGSSCHNRVNLYLGFDKNYRKISEEITGGHFITKEEYQS